MKPTYNNKQQHVKPQQQQHTQLCLSKIFQSVIRKPVLETVWHRSTKLSLNKKWRKQINIKNLFGRIHLDFIPDLRLTRFYEKFNDTTTTTTTAATSITIVVAIELFRSRITRLLTTNKTIDQRGALKTPQMG